MACAAQRPTATWNLPRAGGGSGSALSRGAGGCGRGSRRIRDGQSRRNHRRGRAAPALRMVSATDGRRAMVDAVATAHTLRRPGGDGAGQVSARRVDRGAEREFIRWLSSRRAAYLRPLLGDDAGRSRGLSERTGPGLAGRLVEPPSDLYAQPHPPRAAAAAGGLESAAARAPGADGRAGTRRGGLVAGGVGAAGAAVSAAGTAGARRGAGRPATGWRWM